MTRRVVEGILQYKVIELPVPGWVSSSGKQFEASQRPLSKSTPTTKIGLSGAMSFMVLLTLLFSTVVQAAAPLYGQCGGIGWTGETTCAAGSTCQVQNPYYSQCLASPNSDKSAVPLYGQCGGMNWTGGTKCAEGSTCQVQNPYYSQCLAPPASTSISPSSSTTTSTPKATTTSTQKATTTSTQKATTTSTQKATTTSTQRTTTASIQTTTTTGASSANSVVPLYGQCGGMGWTGGTSCAAGSKCQVQNPYYSQCLASSNGADSGVPLYGQCGGMGWTGGTTCAAGSTCQVQNPYYSQCLAPTASASPSTSNAPSISTSSSTSITTSVPNATTTSAQPSATTSSGPSSNPVYKASFTHYGAGDTFGSPNCNTNTAACGFYTYPGYSAAISQNFYGVGPGAGAGPACGTCWRLTGQTDSSGNALSNAGTTIVVMINNLCPADGNPLCSQNGQTGINQYGANVNFDLCSDSGAQAAFFGNDGVGLALGTATQVDCSQWSGTVIH